MRSERTYEGKATEEMAELLEAMMPSGMPAEARVQLARAVTERILGHPVLVGRVLGEAGVATEAVLGLIEAGTSLEDLLDGLVLGGYLTRAESGLAGRASGSIPGARGYQIQRPA